MATRNYYEVRIAGMPANYLFFSTLQEAKDCVVEYYPWFRSRIFTRRRKDSFVISVINYKPKVGFGKPIKK